MDADWRQIVEAHRPVIVLKIKQKLENLVAPAADDATRETRLNHIATQFESIQWVDASTRHDYTERITKKLKDLEAEAPAAVPPCSGQKAMSLAEGDRLEPAVEALLRTESWRAPAPAPPAPFALPLAACAGTPGAVDPARC